MNGHPNHIKINFGVSLDTFSALIHVLELSKFAQSWNEVLVKEQLGIFLYTCVTSLSSCLVSE